LSRNRNFGVAIGSGKTVQEALSQVGGVAEGFYTAKSAHSLAHKLKVEMPILDQIYQILYEGKSPQKALADLMSREQKDEW
jgi:glycerol-3-phosphate dehydrogenase (NAD(P)+)